ncbi:Esterase FE4 [Eumeta japonica]|uniref:Carboxylic ester hydrolase n=1 Tax=Eumeta variegata TaxID=151549 RepID=A0A4C1UZS4_EUMVA|nr:Esterase FE4 [Eumeta japonica]
MWLIAVLTCCEMALGTLTPALHLRQGRLRGWSTPNRESYYSIPYATAKRFQAAGPPPSWQGVLLALTAGPACAQALYPVTLGREDCLHLDVHVPRGTRASVLRPVMVFLHGGAYYHGTKAHYGPAWLIRHGVVVVVPNYRLGALGFLCVDNVANLGLKDQAAALRWIRDNIAFFGGDPDNVTLFGQSAGASAVGLHMLSPMSAGLFHKAILESGSPLAPWALNPDPMTPAKRDVLKLGKDTDDPQEIVKTFSRASLEELLASTWDTSIDTKYFKYSPCVENASSTENPFLTAAPYDILMSSQFNKVPAIIGFVDLEGLLFYGLHNERTLVEMEENFPQNLPAVFEQCSKRVKQNISSELYAHYFESRPLRANAEGLVRYYSDWVALSSLPAYAALLARTSRRSVYSYVFSYEGNRNFAKWVFGRNVKMNGATHSDDLFYIFQPLGLPLALSSADQLFVDRFTSMWTNFAKTGDPTPETSELIPMRWPVVPADGQERMPTLRLGRRLKVTSVDARRAAPLWRRLLCAYGHRGSAEGCMLHVNACYNQPPTEQAIRSHGTPTLLLLSPVLVSPASGLESLYRHTPSTFPAPKF